jgi:hypothetical protein
VSQSKAPDENPENLTDQGLFSGAQGTGQVANPQHHLWTLHERGGAFSPQVFGGFSDN